MLSDTIAAIATPVGRSAIALVRVSGRDAHEIAGRVLSPFTVDPPRTARRARAWHPATEQQVDDVLYVAYRAPRSYTGEDAVEISTHGGLLAPAEVLGALLAGGARLAAPGEFTRRAVMNGKMDLLQAEAVADLVEATAPAQRRSALSQLDRGLSERISGLRAQVLDLEALVSYDIDFPEEDSGPIPPARVDAAIATLYASLGALLRTSGEGERLREGALAVIAGRPNAGKSSLFNALLGHERAIVTEIAGTTRDAIEAPVECGGFPFRLVDTAGLRESDDRIEQLGIEVSRRYLAAADVVVFCVEAGRPMDASELSFIGAQRAPVVVARTKGETGEVGGGVEGVTVVTSAHTGRGIAELREVLARAAFAGMAEGGDVEPVITRARHRAALERARDEIQFFAEARAAGLEGAVAATHLRAAVTALEDVIGVVTGDEVLGRLFATFCVGK